MLGTRNPNHPEHSNCFAARMVLFGSGETASEIRIPAGHVEGI